MGLQARALAGTDILFHRSYASVISANRHRVPRTFPQLVGPGRNTYPALMHVLLTFAPSRMWPALEHHLPLVMDSLVAAGASALLGGSLDVDTPWAVALAGLYVLSPGITLVNIGPRAFWLTPRVFSQFLFAGVILLAVEGGTSPSWWSVAAQVVLLAGLLLTSKFGVQLVLLCSVPLAVATATPEALLVVAASFVAAYVLSLGFFGRQLLGQFQHLEWYVRRQAPFIYKGTSLRRLLRALRSRQISLVGELLLVRDPILAGLIRHAPGFLGVAWYAAEGGPHSGQQELALAFFVAGVVAWILTSFGILRVLGEAERYLEFVFPASWILFWSLPSEGFIAPIFFAAAALTAVFALVNLTALRRHAARRDTAARDEVVAAAGAHAPGVLLSLEVTEAYGYLAHRDLRICLWNGQQSLRGDTGEFLDWFMLRYPVVHPENLSEIVDRFGVSVIAVRKAVAQRLREQDGLEYDLSGFSRSFESDSYELYTRDVG